MYADVNDGLESAEDDNVVGDYPYGSSTAESGRTFWNMFADYDMTTVNTHFDTGPTYWSQRGTTSIIDFLGIPLAALPRARTCNVNFGLGRSLQLINRRHADHYPVHLDLLLKDRYDQPTRRALTRESDGTRTS